MAIKTKVCTLSSQKFSSNVIELCLERADEDMRNELIKEIRSSEKLTSINFKCHFYRSYKKLIRKLCSSELTPLLLRN